MIWRIKATYNFFRYNVPYGIKNLTVWFPIVWKDRDYDWVYLADMMRLKCERMARLQRDYGCHVGAEKMARDLSIVAHDLKFLIDINGPGPEGT